MTRRCAVLTFALTLLLMTKAACSWVLGLPYLARHPLSLQGSVYLQFKPLLPACLQNRKISPVKRCKPSDTAHFSDQNEEEEFVEQKNANGEGTSRQPPSRYDLGIGKNKPLVSWDGAGEQSRLPSPNGQHNDAAQNWVAPAPVVKPEKTISPWRDESIAKPGGSEAEPVPTKDEKFVKRRKMVARDQASQRLRGAIWDEEHYSNKNYVYLNQGRPDTEPSSWESLAAAEASSQDEYCGVVEKPATPVIAPPALLFPDIDMSIPSSVYNETYDAVWDLLRYEALLEAQREPLLVSFLYSTILNHPSLESSLAFLLANRLSSPMMISTQLQSLILQALETSPEFCRSVRADMLAVRDRDPACTCLPDVFLYFKGFQALQSHRVAHVMWKTQSKHVLAHYLQSQVSQIFQIDIHPNATLGSGIMLDHGTGIVIGETATVGNNCSILHHVTLGGSGKKGVDRHPKVRDGVLLGAGATVLGNVVIGEGCQVGAGTLVISDLPPHSVAVGVPAKIIGSFIDITEKSQPSKEMDQLMTADNLKIATFESFGI